MPTAPSAYIGIDLGTTNSVVARLDEQGRPVTMSNSEGDLLTPSVVFFEEHGPPIVGKEAIRAGLIEPAHMADGAKRDMGKDAYHRSIRGKTLPPAAISGVILHRLVKDIQENLGPIERAVVTVPAYFNEPRRKATMDAAQLAGLKEVILLNEPTAAALSFGFHMGVFTQAGAIANTATKVPGQYTLLVYDLGGGTFDVTIMHIRDRHFEAQVCDGDVQLGGRDWDQRIVDYIAQCLKKEFDYRLLDDPEGLAQARVVAEEAKRSLTQRSQTVMRVAAGGHRIAIELTRDDLLKLTDDLLARTRLTCELALMEAKLAWADLDAILLVGGSSRMPMVRDMLFAASGIEPSRSVSPDEAVAHGAALYAGMHWGHADAGEIVDEVRQGMQPAKITDVNSHSLGIIGRSNKTNQRKVSFLIPRNTKIPHSNSKIFLTRQAGQPFIYIPVVEGESTEPDECALIGECKIKGLPKELPVGTPVTVTFAYRRDGRIFVEAQVKGSTPFQVEIDRQNAPAPMINDPWMQALLGDAIGGDDSGIRSTKPAPKVEPVKTVSGPVIKPKPVPSAKPKPKVKPAPESAFGDDEEIVILD